MNKEIPSAEDLARKKAELESKVAANKAKINKDIEEKILGMEAGRKQVKDLEVVCAQAEENLAYYEKLEATGHLPEDELENYEKAKELVLSIKKNMSDFNEASAKTMTVKGVEEKIQEDAGGINDKIEKEKQEKIKKELIENKFSNFLDELMNEAKEVKETLDKLYSEWWDYRKKVITPIEERFNGEKDFFHKSEYSGYDNIHNETNGKIFKRYLEDYKKNLGMLRIGDKRAIDKILSGKELDELENKAIEYRNFLKLKFGERGNYGHEDLTQCMKSLLGSNENIEKYMAIHELSRESRIYMGSIVEKVLENKEGVVKNLNKVLFEYIVLNHEARNKKR